MRHIDLPARTSAGNFKKPTGGPLSHPAWSFLSLLALSWSLAPQAFTAEKTTRIDARMMRQPDVSATQITFVYAGDIWVAPKSGGEAVRLIEDRLRGLKLRWFFKEALRGFLPDATITKRKQGFGLPFGVWATRHAALRRLADDALHSLGQRGIVDAGFMRRLMEEHLGAHPGYAATNLQAHDLMSRALNPVAAQSAAMGALPSLYAAVSPDVVQGGYYGPQSFGGTRGYPGRAGASRRARNEGDASRLWDVSEQLTGVSFSLGK